MCEAPPEPTPGTGSGIWAPVRYKPDAAARWRNILLELAVVLVLVVLNSVFALSELAVVSARRARLRAMADAGQPGTEAALALATEPGRFLSIVQIGIALVGVLMGA